MRRLTFLIAVVVFTASSCQFKSSNTAHDIRILIDCSGSLPDEVFDGAVDKVADLAREWADRTSSGSEIEVWGFTDKGNGYPAKKYFEWVMPRLGVPVPTNRARAIQQLEQQLHTALKEIPRTKPSPSLEAVYLVSLSVSVDRNWELHVMSDLIEIGPKWVIGERFSYNSETTTKQMGSLCRAIENPPDKIYLHTYPGTFRKGKTSLEIHKELVDLFLEFFQGWAGHDQVFNHPL